MKHRILLMVATAAVLLSPSARSANAACVDVSYGDFMDNPDATRSISVLEGTSVDVALYSNRTTGFEWEVPEIGNTNVLEFEGRRFAGLYDDSASDPMMPGRDVFTFEATGKGQSTVVFRYSRPWKGGQRGVWAFTLIVNIT